MRNTLTRVWAYIASLFAGAPPPKRSMIAARQNMHRLATHTEPVKNRYKTGGPNWLKIAINSQKHR